MAGPLSGVAAAPQIPLAQSQTSQPSSRDSAGVNSGTEVAQDNTSQVEQSSPVVETQSTETGNTGDVSQQEVSVASADQQVEDGESERGSLVDISV